MFTNDEVQFITAVFNKPSINPLDPNAVKAIELARSIVRKMNELKEKDNGEQSSRDAERVTSSIDLDNEPRRGDQNSVA